MGVADTSVWVCGGGWLGGCSTWNTGLVSVKDVTVRRVKALTRWASRPRCRCVGGVGRLGGWGVGR